MCALSEFTAVAINTFFFDDRFLAHFKNYKRTFYTIYVSVCMAVGTARAAGA